MSPPSFPRRTVPRPRGGWGRTVDYLLCGCLGATGGLVLAARFPASIAVSMAFAIWFTASAAWRALDGDRWRGALQAVAVLAWFGWIRIYALRVRGGIDSAVVQLIGVAFLLAGGLLVARFAGVFRRPPATR